MPFRSAVVLALVLGGTLGLAAVAPGARGPDRLAIPADSKPKPRGDLGKLSGGLPELRIARVAGRDTRRVARAEDLHVSPGGRVLVDVYVKHGLGAAADALRAQGMKVQAVSRDPFAIVEGLLPIAKIEEAASLGRVRALTGVHPGGVDVGGTLSQGDAAHRGPQARALGPNGSGVTVGVISDSIDQQGGGVSDSQGSGDLPADVTVLKDATGGSDEGRAMAEIIYDGAPGVPRFLFASGTGDGAEAIGPAGKADSIDQLVASGANVIADDIFYLTEPFFQDGTVAQAVDAARTAGTAYFASAGNRARQSWEGNFVPTGVDDLNDFDPGAGVDQLQAIASVPNGASFSLELQWDEPWGAAQTDLDLFLGRVDTLTLLDSGEDNNVTGGLARESVSWTNNTGAARTVGINILRYAGDADPFMKYIARGNFGTFTIAEYDTSSDTINPDAASALGALTTAAIAFDDPGLDTPEPFSSRGPKERIFDEFGNFAPELRLKPDIAAADKVSTSVPGFDPFFGTSAATPSAAGIGALILSAKPTNIAEDVYAILTEGVGANDCPAEGNPDTDCGVGFVFADSALTRALDPTSPTVTPSLSPASPNGKNGFYVRQDVTVGFAASDDGSPITTQTGCAPVTINTDTPPAGTTITCTARSAGGTTSTPVTIKRDDKKPAVSGFKAAKKIAVKKKGKAATRKGTSLRFNLSEAATVTVTIHQKKGRRFKKRRTFTRSGKAGANKIPFSGRIKVRGKARNLKPGTYRITLKAEDLAGNPSSAARRKIKIVKK